MAKYLELVEVQPPFKRAKTKVFRVDSSIDGSLLGWVQWYSPWRRYVFHPQFGCRFNAKCLSELTTELDVQTSLRKINQTKVSG